jgi:hypothetical protein
MRIVTAVVFVTLLSSCGKSPGSVDSALARLHERSGPHSFVIFSAPTTDRFVQFTRHAEGDIDFQFPIKMLYTERGRTRLLFDVIVEEMPSEGIIETTEILSEEEFARLEKFLKAKGFSYEVSVRGGRDPADGIVRAYMRQVKGKFDIVERSGQEFVDGVFEQVFLSQRSKRYRTEEN